MPFTISLNLYVTVKIFESYVHRLLNNVASFFFHSETLRLHGLKCKARGSKCKARRLEGSRLEIQGSKAQHIEYSIRSGKMMLGRIVVTWDSLWFPLGSNQVTGWINDQMVCK